MELSREKKVNVSGRQILASIHLFFTLEGVLHIPVNWPILEKRCTMGTINKTNFVLPMWLYNIVPIKNQNYDCVDN